MGTGPEKLLQRVMDAVRACASTDDHAGEYAGGHAGVRAGAHGGVHGGDPEGALQALAALHELRDLLQEWEPTLIASARAGGVSWARLAPVLGVGTRQAAERRYLRMRPGGDEALTREQRVQAARDERAGDRAVAAWARANASALRQLAGQASAVDGLGRSGRRRARTLASSLTADDPSSLLAPLADLHGDLLDQHGDLADRVDAVGRSVARIRRDTQRRRDAADPA